jgi:hypothetical protein
LIKTVEHSKRDSNADQGSDEGVDPPQGPGKDYEALTEGWYAYKSHHVQNRCKPHKIVADPTDSSVSIVATAGEGIKALEKV